MDTWYQSMKNIYPTVLSSLTDSYTHCIRCKCDLEVLFMYKIRLQRIANLITSEYDDLLCVWSPNSLGIVDIWINTDVVDLSNNEIQYICK